MGRKHSLEDWKRKLAENIRQAEYQSQFAGVRLGVFQRLRELDRERARIENKIAELEIKEHSQ